MARSISVRKAQQWQQRLARFQSSRQSVVAFCRQEGVTPQSFYYWRKGLAKASSQPGVAAQPPAGFRPVRIVPAAGVSVQLPGGTQLVVPLADADGLRVAIETIARVDAQQRGVAASC